MSCVALRVAYLNQMHEMATRNSVAYRLLRKWRRYSLRHVLRVKGQQAVALALHRRVATPSCHENVCQGDVQLINVTASAPDLVTGLCKLRSSHASLIHALMQSPPINVDSLIYIS